MKITKFNLNSINVESVLLAIIICMNAVRYIMGISGSSIVVYSMYITFIIVSYLKHFGGEFFLLEKDIAIYCILVFLALGYGIITSVAMGTSMDVIKIFIIFMISYGVLKMEKKDIIHTINYTYALCVVYVVYVLLDFQRMVSYISSGSNYLNVTLPIGMGLSMSLVQSLLEVYNRNNIKRMVVFFSMSVLFFVALLKFSARGSILFPFVVSIVFVVFIMQKNFKKFVPTLLILCVVVYVAVDTFFGTAGEYAIGRMLRMFTENGEEQRWEVWRTYIEQVVQNKWYILGGGAGASEYYLKFYPHNIYLQAIGEYGIFGAIISIYITVLVISRQLKSMNIVFRLKHSMQEFGGTLVAIVAALLYLFLCHMKSFSLYDACSLFVFIALALRVSQIIIKEDFARTNNVKA